MAENATMNLPMDIIKPAIDAHVQAAIVQALGSTDKVISTLIQQVLTNKVDQSGNPCTYSSARPWLQWVTEKMIREVIVETLKKHIDSRKDALTEMISSEMANTKSKLHRKFLSATVEGLADVMKNEYRLQVAFVEKD